MICGGGSCIRGLQDRLLLESRLLAPPSISPAVVATPDYMPKHTNRYATWMGGAILAKVGPPPPGALFSICRAPSRPPWCQCNARGCPLGCATNLPLPACPQVVFPQNHHMTRAEYDERGPTAVHGKCG